MPAEPIERLVDTTGAGDLFAAGFLVGQARGKSLEQSLRLGAIAAAEVIQHYGARPEGPQGAGRRLLSGLEKGRPRRRTAPRFHYSALDDRLAGSSHGNAGK